MATLDHYRMMPSQNTTDLVQLPMYDWIETRMATNALWSCIHHALKRQGIPSPETLDRDQAPKFGWLSSQLLLSQTCGLPLIQELRGRVAVLGCFSWRGQPLSGDYHSVIIARDALALDNINALYGQRVAINHESSYSGCLALKRWMSLMEKSDAIFSKVITTGSHRHSVQAVATGLADIAAIDCISWALARRFDTTAQSLKVVARTDDRPGLPLITAVTCSPFMIDKLRIALNEAVTILDPTSRDVLGITAFVVAHEHDYDIIDHDLQRFGDTALVSDRPTMSSASAKPAS
jgi:ABC-type phosphate/phosphonate transport system substrate-binding protein